MKIAKLQPQGMIRNPKNRTAEDGASAEIVNMRSKEGGWSPVGEKKLHQSLNESTEQFIFHPINDQYESYVYVVGSDVKAKVVDKITEASTIVVLLTGISGKIILKPFYNVLLVSSVENFSLSSFVFDVDAGAYLDAFPRLNDNLFSLEYNRAIYDILDDPRDYEVSGIYATDEHDFYFPYDWAEVEETITAFNNLKGDLENKNYPIGSIFVQLTISLSNGAEIPIGPLQQIRLGDIYIETTFEDPYVPVFNAKGYLYSIFVESPLMSLLNSDLSDMLSSVNVYLSRPLSVSLRETHVRAESYYIFSGEDSIEKISTLKRVGSFPLKKANITSAHVLETGNTENHILDVPDPSSPDDEIEPLISIYDSLDDGKEEISTLHHLIPLNNIATYNDRIILSGVGTNLFKGYNISKFVSPTLSTELNKIYSIITEDYVMETGTSTEPVQTLATTLDSLYFLTIYFKLDTESGQKVVKSDEILLAYVDPEDTDEIAFALKNVQYPDSRAFEYVVVLTIPADQTTLTEDGHYSITKKLKKHDFLDLAFSDENFVIRHQYPTVQTDPSTLTGTLTHTTTFPSIDTTYKTMNRVQASATGTVFSFPAKYSYRIGMDEVLNVTAISDELSQGQFGQFPLVAFTKSGIWAMEIGQGDVFISNIVPLANELCNNPDGITVIRRGIVFPTREGLKVLNGKKITQFSQPIEGPPTRLPINGKFTLNTILERNNLSAMVDTTPFKTYMEEALIGYDHHDDRNEMIISNPDYAYSYIYSLNTQTWTKIDEVFTAFSNQFPYNFGLKSDNLYLLHEEDEIAEKQIILISRPFFLIPDIYKKMQQSVIRGQLSNARAYLFGATEGERYNLIAAGDASQELGHIYIHRANYSVKSFILVITASMKPEEYISDIDFQFKEKFANKLR